MPDGQKAGRNAAERTGLSVDVIRSEEVDQEWRRYHERFGQVVRG